MSLGGVHDEAEIRGHRRTYIGSLPGNIVQAVRKAGRRNPVLMLDEVDKLSASYQGDPFSALLEVLDPEQNNTFRDNYLGVPFDLSKVLFIGTANVLDSIPAPLRDRMEIIELTGYTEEEKLQIAKRYLLKRQLEANGLSAEQVQISDEALRRVIADYTREAGCETWTPDRRAAAQFRGHHRLRRGAKRGNRCGRRGRFWAPRASKTTWRCVPASRGSRPGSPGRRRAAISVHRIEPGEGHRQADLDRTTGRCDEGSAQAAVTLIKSQADRLGIDPAVLDNSDLHIHVPAGAIPRDGPVPGSRWPHRWHRCRPSAPCERTWP